MTHVVFIHGADGFDDDRAMADSLGVPLIYPRMPDTDDWGEAIHAAIERAEIPVTLIGHSAGGYQLLRYLAASPPPSVASVHIIAAPFPGGDPDWDLRRLRPPRQSRWDTAAALPLCQRGRRGRPLRAPRPLGCRPPRSARAHDSRRALAREQPPRGRRRYGEMSLQH